PLSARDRGVPVPPSQDPGRAGVRRRRRPLWRGAVRLGPNPTGRGAHRRRAARVLRRPDRTQQDPALCGIRRRIPDDGHRQDPEIHDARSGRGAAWTEGGEDGVRRIPSPRSCGERVRVRGCLRKLEAPEYAESPLTRRFAPTSPPKRGEVESYTGNPAFFASSLSDTCGRAPMCWITSAAASAPRRPAFT